MNIPWEIDMSKKHEKKMDDKELDTAEQKKKSEHVVNQLTEGELADIAGGGNLTPAQEEQFDKFEKDFFQEEV